MAPLAQKDPLTLSCMAVEMERYLLANLARVGRQSSFSFPPFKHVRLASLGEKEN